MTAERVDTSAITEGERFTHGYGLGVWIDRAGIYRMDGRYGQYAVICPQVRAAVTVTAHSARGRPARRDPRTGRRPRLR